MDWKQVGKQVLSKGAPLLGGILGGPLGAAAGSMVGNIFGLDDEDTTPDKLMEAINRDAESALKLRQFEMDHKVELEKLRIQELGLRLNAQGQETQAYLADRQDARGRQVKSEQATGSRDVNLYVLAWTVVVGFFGLCLGLMLYPIPAGQNEAVYLLFGGLVAGFTGVIQYFFGSSKGSADKTELLTKRQ